MSAEGYKSLIVYQKADKTAMEIFRESKKFPKEETYALTDQIRRSSRSICVNIAEAYRKKSYPKHFISTLIISDGECAETMVHLDFAKDCEYISKKTHQQIIEEYIQIGKMLGGMIASPEKFSAKKLPPAPAS